MQRGHKLSHPSALEMPEGFDPSGIPCVDSGHPRTRPAHPHRRHARSLPGLPPASVIAYVQEVAVGAEASGERLIWGCIGDRPALLAVEAGAAAEMMHALTAGETPTAIIEPWQLVLERLD